MSLTEKKFKVFYTEQNDYREVSFVPEMVGGKEVYNVKNSLGKHCGYVTEAFLDALIRISDNKDAHLTNNFMIRGLEDEKKYINYLGRRIILDAPGLIDMLFCKFVNLRPTVYFDDTDVEPLTVIVNSKFDIKNSNSVLDIKTNNNMIDVGSLKIYNVGKDINTINLWKISGENTNGERATIDLNLATNRVGNLNIDGFYGESAFGGPYLKLKCTNEEVAPDVTILGYTIDGNTNDKSEAGYIHFETAGEFAAREGRAYMPKTYAFNGKEPSRIVSKKDGIFLMNSNITLKSEDDLNPVSLVTNGKILLKETDAVLTGKNDIDGIFRCDPTAKQTRKSSVWMRDVASESGIYLKSKNSSECIFRLGNSYLSNGEKDIVMKGEVSLVGVRLNNEIKFKELTLENVNIRYSILNNISDLKNAKISNSEVENFNLTNKSKDTQSFCFGLGTIGYNDINEFYSPKEGADIDKTIYSSIKNTSVTLWEGDWFHDKVGKKVYISNTIIEGDCTIETKYGNRNKAIPITIENSSLSRGYFSFGKDDNKPISIINSEIAYNVEAINLELIKTSAIKGPVRFNGVTTIEDAMIDKVNFKDGKVTSIVGGNYVSNGETIDGSSYVLNSENTKAGKITEDLELL